MSLKIPDLAGKTYTDFIDEIISSIPKYTGKWTNFNPSDPGITIFELLSFIAETLLYRINRMPYNAYVNFLKMLAGEEDGKDCYKEIYNGCIKCDNYFFCGKYPDNDPELRKLNKVIEKAEKENVPIHELKKAALNFVQSIYRAVTANDFGELAINSTRLENNEIGAVKRAVVVYRPDNKWAGGAIVVNTPDNEPDSTFLDETNNTINSHVRPSEIVYIIIITDPPDQYINYTSQVEQFLYTRKPLGTRIKIIGPEFTQITIKVLIEFTIYADKNKIIKTIKETILTYLDPLKGGIDKKGWPYGRDLYTYDIANIVANIEGIKELNNVIFNNDYTTDTVIVNGLIKIERKDLTIEGC